MCVEKNNHMTEPTPIRIPLEYELHPEVKDRLDAIERHQTEQDTLIEHWRNVAMDAGDVAVKAYKATKGSPLRGGTAIRNTMAICGLVCLGVGCWWLLPALALVVIGSILLGSVIFGTVARYRLESEHARPDS